MHLNGGLRHPCPPHPDSLPQGAPIFGARPRETDVCLLACTSATSSCSGQTWFHSSKSYSSKAGQPLSQLTSKALAGLGHSVGGGVTLWWIFFFPSSWNMCCISSVPLPKECMSAPPHGEDFNPLITLPGPVSCVFFLFLSLGFCCGSGGFSFSFFFIHSTWE